MLMMHANNGCCRQSVLDCFFFICQFVADVGWLSHPLSCAAVVHDKIPLGSVMKWCSRQVIIISLPSVVDCCLFYFVVCCCILLHVIVCCCMIDALFKMDFDNSMMQACCYDGCWMLKQWMMHVDDACWWCMSMMTMPCEIPCILTQIVSIIMVRLLQWMMKNDNVGEQWFYGDISGGL